MRFKEFLQLELQGMFGNIKSTGGNLGVISNHIKDAKPIKNKGTTVGRMAIHVTSPASPAKPAGITSYKKPMTISSVL